MKLFEGEILLRMLMTTPLQIYFTMILIIKVSYIHMTISRGTPQHEWIKDTRHSRVYIKLA